MTGVTLQNIFFTNGSVKTIIRKKEKRNQEKKSTFAMNKGDEVGALLGSCKLGFSLRSSGSNCVKDTLLLAAEFLLNN